MPVGISCNEQAALECLYPATRALGPTGKGREQKLIPCVRTGSADYLTVPAGFARFRSVRPHGKSVAGSS